ncbi:hal protein kinase [Phlyctema vagabunda]|uniref:non-specific serine/threonine protein kinase n=1 Tax=Phlyctema vagabunda TaxID=108571 RepID=A0ABR4PV03_9HELO
MATVSAQREALAVGKVRPSPGASPLSSTVGSPVSRPTTNGSSVPSFENLNATNGHAAPPSEPQHQKPAPAVLATEKPSMTKRLTRMFSTKDATRSQDSISSLPAKNSTVVTPGPDTPTTTTIRPSPPTRTSSSNDKTSTSRERSTTAPTKGKPAAANAVHQRYVVMPNVQGGHEHHLKSAKRQEKLSDMLRNVISGKAKNIEQHEGDQQLSLMSSWVDQLKREKESLASASDRKGGPNATATLVEKYGKCQEIVGRGAFGIVRISHKRLEGAGEQLYAVKEFRRRPEENERKYSKRLTSEFCISSSLRHPNVIHTLDLLQDAKGDYCEVMEFCAGGDLYTLVLAAGKLEVNEADCYFKQMMRGVEYMHEMGVAHRDLKPENLLLTTHGSLKITDFGNGECFRMAWETDAHMVTGLCGSAPYIAPEEYIDSEFDARAVDVWATGVIYMAMRTGRHLWRVAKKDEDEFYERYLAGRRDEEGYAPIESLHRARCRNVIYSILDPNPSRRITASQVLKSEWGREIKLCKAGEEGL